jgi:membrane-associated phospholipid phosphatase
MVPPDYQRATTVRVILLACVAALLGLAYAVDSGWAFGWWDFTLAHLAAQAAHGYDDPRPYAFFSAIGLLGDWRIAVLIAALCLLAVGRRRAAWTALLPLMLILTVVLEYLTKETVHQPWPTPDVVGQSSLALARYAYTQVPQAVCLPSLALTRSQLIAPTCMDGSFLSGAAARVVILAGMAVWWARRRPWPGEVRGALYLALLGYVLAVGVGRVYLRWHWPSDVLGGYLLGASCLCGMWLFAHPARAARRAAQGDLSRLPAVAPAPREE